MPDVLRIAKAMVEAGTALAVGGGAILRRVW